MATVIPISELIGDPLTISRLCHSQDEPVFLTKDGHGDMVVMSIEQYEILKSQALSNIAKSKVLENTGNKNADSETDGTSGEENLKKMEAESSLRDGIQKLPIEDVYDILKDELDRLNHDGSQKRRFPR